MIWEIPGDSTGRVWRFHPTSDRISAPGSCERFRANAVDDPSLAYIHRCEKGGDWQEDVGRMRSAVAVARLPGVAAAPEIRQLLDTHETTAVEGDFGHRGHLTAIWEWADKSLLEFLSDQDQPLRHVIVAVERNVGRALDVLHSIGIVHCDVAPNNILRVRGDWKLADLDACVCIGDRMNRQPRKAYVHPGRWLDNAVARTDFDLYGLAKIIDMLKGQVDRS